MEVVVPLLLLGSLLLLAEGRRAEASRRVVRLIGSATDRGRPAGTGWQRVAGTFGGRKIVRGAAAVAGAYLGLQVAGPAGVVGGAMAGWIIPKSLDRRRVRRRQELLERQLSDLVETSAGAVRSGLSIAQALEFAAAEAAHPMRGLMEEFMAERAMGTSLEDGLDRFADAVGTDEARMFVLILSIHVKSGGNLAAPLQEVASTIHHRMAVRRELRALTAQGRVSGAILGGLPIAFFLVLSATSRRELGPIYRSAAGVAMLATGLGLEGLAYLWIRRLMRVRA